MADFSTALAAGAAAALPAAAMSGLPPGEVVAWSVIGGLVSVWLSRPRVAAVTPQWLAGTLAHIGVSAATGVALSALLQALATASPALAPLAEAPRWALAAVIAALAHTVAPMCYAAATRWLGRSGNPGGPDAQ